MTDPRNVAHDKKVQQEKKHQNVEIAPGADKTPQPGKKTHMEHHASDTAKVPAEAVPVDTGEKPLEGTARLSQNEGYPSEEQQKDEIIGTVNSEERTSKEAIGIRLGEAVSG